MECNHIANCSKITKPLFKRDGPFEWNCSECNTNKSPWICLYCGVINCGRYVNGHAKSHFEANPEHMVCLDCNNYAAFCYVCDEFVVNETPELIQLRKVMEAEYNSSSEIVVQTPKRQNSINQSDGENVPRKKPKQTNKNFCKVRSAGLRNLGNTCFMNAVLQSLSNIQQFSCYFKQLPVLEKKKPPPNSKKKTKNDYHVQNGGNEALLAEELRKTIISLWQGSKTAISPESLFAVIWKVVPRFRGYQQQDAHEFLRYMLDRLHMELLNILPYPTTKLMATHHSKATIVTTIFGGILQNEVTCLVCETESRKHDPFLDLSLDIPQPSPSQANNTHAGNNTPNKGGKDEEPLSSVHLLDCLASFTELEELAETELYHCHNCKNKQRSTKRFWIRRLPNVLCLHLKRFRWNNYFRTKIDNFVEFPLRGLDMSRFMLAQMHETRGTAGGSPFYDLAAVIVHHGSGAGSGHYTAYATHEGCWHHFNDSTVTVTDEETVAKCKAYILFYIRRELNLTPFSL